MNRLACVVCCLLIGLLIAWPPVQAEQSFGRFFTTAEERRQLDALRRRAVNNDNGADEGADEERPAARQLLAAPLDTIELKGLVYRRGRRGSAWINGANINDAQAADEQLLTPADGISKTHVTIVPPGADDAYRLRVGESLDPNTGLISDMAVKQSGRLVVIKP